ncbi:hypothetical protein C5O72_12285 [Muribaculum intestinale]|nr:hypothetical protein ADH68_02815 [Muribaculum intestinale]PWB00663.1 hypothetical protein C5O29_11730 [Muribaculum intestinale]PWB07441.1 hypothetical protein C5O72_12285 [Muribaculum intestinale]
MSFFLINDIRLNLPMGWVPFQLLYLGPFSNVRCNLSEQLPSLKEKVPTKLTMKQKEALRKEKKEPETDLNGNVIVPRYECVTSHTARRTGITNMYLSHKYTILQMMHVSGHKTQKTFMDYIKLSSEEIADEIAAMSKKESDMW